MGATGNSGRIQRGIGNAIANQNNPYAPAGSGVESVARAMPQPPVKGNMSLGEYTQAMNEYMKKIAEFQQTSVTADPNEFGPGMVVTDPTQAQQFVESRQANKDMARTESLIAKRRRMTMAGGFGRSARRGLTPTMLGGFKLGGQWKSLIGA